MSQRDFFLQVIDTFFIFLYFHRSTHNNANPKRLALDGCRSYVFRLSAPKAATKTTSPSANGAPEKKTSTAGDEKTKPDRRVDGAPEEAAAAPGPQKTQLSMLPPPGGRALKRSSKPGGDGSTESWAEPKAVGKKTGSKKSASNVDSEQEAMLMANLPSTFGAARDRPLGKRADREAHIVRGTAGAVISGASGRFVTGRKGINAGNGDAVRGDGEDTDVDKDEARRRRQSEIAAITAELAQTRTNSGEPVEKSDGQADERARGRLPQFKPGGWRHATENGKGRSAGVGGRKKLQRTIDGSRDEEEDESEGEYEMEEEQEMTDEMRIKLVVRRLGLPVSHEVQLSGHRKGVTALALDRAGGRVATGSNDYKVLVK